MNGMHSLERNEDLMIRTESGTVYSCKELNSDKDLMRIAEWGFPIFHVAERHPKTTLSRVRLVRFLLVTE
ncbi:unnamed protein product [Gongylonema pulchrum]|uniref:Acetyltransferase n=1 Tax=Gongylonema pulchrum TaxID=637853 RepID=A0A183DMQ6_9BILA|nr:unnamed protein product [Gongylonema pulchrum]